MSTGTFFVLCVLMGICRNLILCDDVVNKIENHGFHGETHFVRTKDGYILRMHRLHAKNSTANNRPVLFLMHGIFGASLAYLVYPYKSAGYYFGNLGYDVWMGNARGNMFSRNHTSLDPENAEFWKFSWHEIGIYDLPAMIDYILSMTKQLKLMYVGHSQGVTTPMVMLSMKPEYNEKISILHAMTAPVILKYHGRSYPDNVMQRINELEEWSSRTHNQELFPESLQSTLISTSKLCLMPVYRSLCRFSISQLNGPSPHYYDKMQLDTSDHYPTSASYRQAIHYGQISLTGKFQKYDHGSSENVHIYGSETPPEYDLSKITTKIHLIYGGNDWLIPPKNMKLLVQHLNNSMVVSSEFTDFNHVDFTYCKEIALVQAKILEITKKFETNPL